MLQPSPVRATPFRERLRTGAGRRTLGLSLALFIEALLLLALLTLGRVEQPGEKDRPITTVNLEAEEPAKEEPEPEPEREQQSEARPVPKQPPTEVMLPPTPVPPQPAPPPPAIIIPRTAPLPPAAIPPSPVQPAPSPKRVYGPPDARRGAAFRDSERVGTAPNGEPLYAAEWYREPTDEQLGDYLSTASGPGWGQIICRTVPNYRVEDCVALDEYPSGSQINRAILAAAWELRVRPPRLGGRSLVGGWVRIHITYGIKRR